MIGDVVFAYRKAHTILWQHGQWKVLIVPFFISVVLAIVLAGGSFLLAAGLSNWAHESLSARLDYPDWLRHLLLIVLFLAGLGPCYVMFRGLVMVCYGPWLDQLSTTAEQLLNGQKAECQRGTWESLKRPILMALLTIGASIGVFILGLLVGSIPLVGVLISGCVISLAQLFLSAVGFLDPYLDRCGYSPLESWRQIRRRPAGVILFGLIGMLLTLVPVIGWFVGPTYSVVAGVVYGALIAENPSQKPS